MDRRQRVARVTAIMGSFVAGWTRLESTSRRRRSAPTSVAGSAAIGVQCDLLALGSLILGH
jgi:hypothetical protein